MQVTENVKKLAAEYTADPNCRAQLWINDCVSHGECTKEEAMQFMYALGKLKLFIKKKPYARGFLYEVFVSVDGHAQKIGQRKSDRTYIAAAVWYPNQKYVWGSYGEKTRTDYGVAGWIGREDLIPKNEYVAKYGCLVARLVEEPKEFEK